MTTAVPCGDPWPHPEHYNYEKDRLCPGDPGLNGVKTEATEDTDAPAAWASRLAIAERMIRPKKGEPLDEQLHVASVWATWVETGEELGSFVDQAEEIERLHAEAEKFAHEITRLARELDEARTAFTKIENAHSIARAQVDALQAERARNAGRDASLMIAQANADKWRARAKGAMALVDSGEAVDAIEAGLVDHFLARLVGVLKGESEESR